MARRVGYSRLVIKLRELNGLRGWLDGSMKERSIQARNRSREQFDPREKVGSFRKIHFRMRRPAGSDLPSVCGFLFECVQPQRRKRGVISIVRRD
jgi:hypothetical protein